MILRGGREAWLWTITSAASLSLLASSLGDDTAWGDREGDGGSDYEGDAEVASLVVKFSQRDDLSEVWYPLPLLLADVFPPLVLTLFGCGDVLEYGDNCQTAWSSSLVSLSLSKSNKWRDFNSVASTLSDF